MKFWQYVGEKENVPFLYHMQTVFLTLGGSETVDFFPVSGVFHSFCTVIRSPKNIDSMKKFQAAFKCDFISQQGFSQPSFSSF